MTATAQISTWIPLRKETVLFQTTNFNPFPTVFYIGANGKPTGEKVHFPASKSFVAMDSIRDVKTGRNRVIAFRKNQSSIYQDEQSQAVQDNPSKFPAEQIEFNQRGQLVVSSLQEAQLLEFLSLSNYCGNNPGRNPKEKVIYNYVEEGKIHNDLIQRENDIDKLKQWIMGKVDGGAYVTPFESVKVVAISLGMSANQEESSLRWSLWLAAKSDPKRFENILLSPDTKRKYWMRLALQRNIIQVTANNSIKWINGQTICDCPQGKDAVEYFVSLKTESAETAYSAIREYTESAAPADENVIVNTIVPSKEEVLGSATKEVLENTNVTYPEELVTLIKSAMKAGVIDAHLNRKYAKYISPVTGEHEWKGSTNVSNKIYAFFTVHPEELDELKKNPKLI